MSARDVELWVAKDAPVADVMEWAVLTVYAEQADEDGCSAFRSHKTVAAITRMSVDCVKGRVRDLESRGILRRGDQSAAAYLPEHSRPVVYDIMIPYSWFGSRLDRINRGRAERGRAPLEAADRPELPPVPAKRRRRDQGMTREDYRALRQAEEEGGASSAGGGATSTPGIQDNLPLGLEAPRGSERRDPGASSPTTKPFSTTNQNQDPSSAPQAAPTDTNDGTVTPIRASKTDTARGTRLPADWIPDESLVDWTRQKCPAVRRGELDRFRDYWAAQPGAKGRKADWSATWRNWCRRIQDDADAGRAPSARTAQPQPRAMTEAQLRMYALNPHLNPEVAS